MGKRHKKGKSVKNNKNVNVESEELVQAPHSFVIHRGLPGGNILELTKDFRRVMEPFTASELKERNRNTIKDFVSIAGPLHVSHLTIFSRTEMGMYMKLSRLPRGPTLTFKLHNFSLARDVVSSLKKQLVVEKAFKHSPLIVLNSFSGEGMQMKLMASMFQNMFPTINLTNVDLNTVRRCVLMNYNPGTKLIDFRHYNIKIVPVGVSKGVKKVVQGKIPNLSRCNDISEFFTKAGLMSESEAEDDPNNHVTLPQKIISRGNVEAGKSAIRLVELGPRMSLQLIKIEDGLLDGEVLYHDLVEKTEEEKALIEKKREAKKKSKEKRKKIQEQNVKTKEDAKKENKEKSLKGMKQDDGEPVQEKLQEKNDDDADDDAEYYRQEVGAEPDKDLFTKSQNFKRPPRTHHSINNKRRMDSSRDGPPRKKFRDGGDKKDARKHNPKKKSGKGVDKTNRDKRDQRGFIGVKDGQRGKGRFFNKRRK